VAARQATAATLAAEEKARREAAARAKAAAEERASLAAEAAEARQQAAQALAAAEAAEAARRAEAEVAREAEGAAKQEAAAVVAAVAASLGAELRREEMRISLPSPPTRLPAPTTSTATATATTATTAEAEEEEEEVTEQPPLGSARGGPETARSTRGGGEDPLRRVAATLDAADPLGRVAATLLAGSEAAPAQPPSAEPTAEPSAEPVLMARVRAMLGIDAVTPLVEAVDQANQMMGVEGAGEVAAQVAALARHLSIGGEEEGPQQPGAEATSAEVTSSEAAAPADLASPKPVPTGGVPPPDTDAATDRSAASDGDGGTAAVDVGMPSGGLLAARARPLASRVTPALLAIATIAPPSDVASTPPPQPPRHRVQEMTPIRAALTGRAAAAAAERRAAAAAAAVVVALSPPRRPDSAAVASPATIDASVVSDGVVAAVARPDAPQPVAMSAAELDAAFAVVAGSGGAPPRTQLHMATAAPMGAPKGSHPSNNLPATSMDEILRIRHAQRETAERAMAAANERALAARAAGRAAPAVATVISADQAAFRARTAAAAAAAKEGGGGGGVAAARLDASALLAAALLHSDGGSPPPPPPPPPQQQQQQQQQQRGGASPVVAARRSRPVARPLPPATATAVVDKENSSSPNLHAAVGRVSASKLVRGTPGGIPRRPQQRGSPAGKQWLGNAQGSGAGSSARGLQPPTLSRGRGGAGRLSPGAGRAIAPAPAVPAKTFRF